MQQSQNLNARIVESLYCEALILADEVRSAFAVADRDEQAVSVGNLVVAALSCEALRTTTRMMHALAWLLNHRAFFKGELSEFQLRRNGGLSPDSFSSDSEKVALIDQPRRELIGMTELFYARLQRLERVWGMREREAPSPVAELRKRLGSTVARQAAG
jgi:regulator of CtrA degradation